MKSKYCGVLVEMRKFPDLQVAIDRHMDFLPGWDFYHHDTSDIYNLATYNYYLTSEVFWKMFVDYERVLIFHYDSGLLRTGIEEFFPHSYVGAPWIWDKEKGPGGNGGLSLRCPKKTLELIRSYPFNPKMMMPVNTPLNEDVYCSRFIEGVAPFKVCSRFSVETIFKLGTLGYHGIEKYLEKEQCDAILNQYQVEVD